LAEGAGDLFPDSSWADGLYSWMVLVPHVILYALEADDRFELATTLWSRPDDSLLEEPRFYKP